MQSIKTGFHLQQKEKTIKTQKRSITSTPMSSSLPHVFPSQIQRLAYRSQKQTSGKPGPVAGM
jgi:hypothetical protein